LAAERLAMEPEARTHIAEAMVTLEGAWKRLEDFDFGWRI
jgi:hypothetical protein